MLYHMVVTVSESGHSPDSYGALLAAGEGGVNTQFEITSEVL